ncbi:MAG: SusD/RagB family nutrient-binding outer membrane lipoprotein, partial [Cyclobacteriaceae bacterium]|nr:SusD/RagB family nutrient-binding outer membrane lipoprotein [Cyclobacteriaceae bacterium]
MKKNNSIMNAYSKVILTAIFMLGFIACDERFEEVNTNPNGIADVDPAHLFASGARASFRSGISGGYDYRVGAQLAHFYVGIQNDRQIDKYQHDLTGGTYESLFGSEYQSKIKYYNEIMKLTGPGMEKENKFQFAVSDVMAVLAYSILTDAYGSIPYFEGG